MLSWSEGAFEIYIGRRVDLYRRLLHIVLPSIESAKASHAQLLPIYLSEVIRFSLRLIASIPLVQQRKKHRSRGEKKCLPVVVFCIYARSLKDQARKSNYPRT